MKSFGSYNLATIGISDGSAGIGRAVLANEAAFNATFFSKPLTDFAVGFKSDEKKVDDLLAFLAPKVRTTRKFQYKVADNADAFAVVSDDSDARALGGQFKTVATTGNIVDSHTVSKGLSTVVDRDDLEENPNALEEKVAWLMLLLKRADALRAWTLLANGATNTAKTWSAEEGTPDQDLLEKIDAAGDSLGFNPNRILFGSTAWQKRLLCLGSKNTAGGFAGYSLSPDALAQFLAVDKVMVSSERYTSGTGKAKIVGAAIALMFTGSDSASTEDPSNAKTFWSPVMGGGEYAVFKDETQAEFVKVTVMHKSQIVLTNTLGMQKLTIS